MKTVLNKKNIDQLRNPMFLGEDLSLQRYDLIKYPKFYDLYDQQLNFFWRPQEVSLVKDISDYKNLSPEERFVFDSNLKFQTMTDSMLSRSIHELMKRVTNSELEICMNAWSFFETIHSNSYTYILNNVYPDATKFFDSSWIVWIDFYFRNFYSAYHVYLFLFILRNAYSYALLCIRIFTLHLCITHATCNKIIRAFIGYYK